MIQYRCTKRLFLICILQPISNGLKALTTVGRKLISGNYTGVEFVVFVVLLRAGRFATFRINGFLKSGDLLRNYMFENLYRRCVLLDIFSCWHKELTLLSFPYLWRKTNYTRRKVFFCRKYKLRQIFVEKVEVQIFSNFVKKMYPIFFHHFRSSLIRSIYRVFRKYWDTERSNLYFDFGRNLRIF